MKVSVWRMADDKDKVPGTPWPGPIVPPSPDGGPKVWIFS